MSTVGKMQWKMSTNVTKSVILSGGKVFGGAVRDNVLHCHASNNFDKLYSDRNAAKADYNNPQIHPKLADRLIVPKDIDCFFDHHSDVIRFKSMLKSDGYNISIKAAGAEYDDLPTDMSITTFVAKPKMSKLIYELFKDSNIPIDEVAMSIDVIWSNGPYKRDMPFNDIDFACNALIFNKSSLNSGLYDMMPVLSPYIVSQKGVRSTFEYTKVLHDILEQIVEKRAVIVHRVSHRVEKMRVGGWSIKDTKVYQPLFLMKENSETCAICLDDVFGSNHYMRTCCKGHYCKGCISEVVAKCKLCPHCRSEF
jgi:hypothetical protein